MDRYFYEELKCRCREINELPVDPDRVKEALGVYLAILRLSVVARDEGLLALEAEVNKPDPSVDPDGFLRMLILLVVDGLDPELLEEDGLCRYAALNTSGYRGFILLMCIRGTLMIQFGHNRNTIATGLKAMCPPAILKAIEDHEEANKPDPVKTAVPGDDSGF